MSSRQHLYGQADSIDGKEGGSMKRTIKEILLSVFLGLVVPVILLSRTKIPDNKSETPSQAVTEPSYTKSNLTMHLMLSDGSVQDMDMEDYLVGVVLAEMPASFETEALKAQAVVARTYTLKCIQSGTKHDGSVCTDYACCQAYIWEEEYNGGKDNLEKVRSAVLATSGQVLTYQGDLIEATYFSCSGGTTEDAVAVWGTDFPYLRSVDSPGEEYATHFSDMVSFTAKEFQDALGQKLSGSMKSWFGFTTYTAGGGVNTMRIGGVDYKGTEIRSRLGLRSTAFEVSVSEDMIAITTKGYGHRVGMSQYGADAMAVSGSSYDQILAHYYQGSELVLFDN